MQTEIILGTILSSLSVGILIYFGIFEDQRMSDYVSYQHAEEIEVGAMIYNTYCTRCHGTKAQGTELAPCLRCEDLFSTRLGEMGWEGSLEDFLIFTISNGRRESSRPEQFPGRGDQAMPIWAEAYGGTLREDQIQALAAFIINLEAYAVGEVPIPEDLAPLMALADDPVARGKYAFQSNECNDCHKISGLSEDGDCPPLDGIATRAAERLEGYTAEEYIRESILEPRALLVEVDKDIRMPPNFGEELSEEQIDDIVAFLLTLEK